MIADGVYIHPTAEIVDSILMPGVHIGSGVRIRRAIIDENVQVRSGAKIGYDHANGRLKREVLPIRWTENRLC